MISENRIYHYVGVVNLERSKVLNLEDQPKDDKVNWMFLKVGQRQFGFIYKIENPSTASYKKPFNIYISFLLDDVVKKLVNLNSDYELLRGNEIIGSIKLQNII